MRIFAIDDELEVLETLHEAIGDAVPGAEILDFRRGQAALDAVTEQGACPDIVFSDIRMPDMDGLQFAAVLKKAAPDAKIVFVTAYSEYALEAWKRHVQGYLVKPVTAEDIRDTLDHLELPAPAPAAQGKLRVRCFGHFEVFFNGEPVIFTRKQSKELLAFLVDRKGGVCMAEEIATALWESETDMGKAKHQIRNLVSDLRSTLRKIGMEDLLIRKSGILAIHAEPLDCDYYQMLRGDPETINAYRGEYMTQYSWAELTAGNLWFQEQA